MKRTYVIAEIGINHNGSLDTAKELIDIAALSGCDAVKFQKRNPDICVPDHQKQKIRETPWGTMTYIEYKYRMEFGKKEYDEIDKYCKEKGIAWSASPWDLDSLDFLMQYDIPWIKIPSAMITNEELMKASAATGKKVIFSTGMSTYEEIDQAVEWLAGSETLMLHCNSSYPAPLEDLNLKCIQTLKERYNCEVGYSGHEFRLGTSVAAIYLGATCIERHITLDRTMYGSDQAASITTKGFKELIGGIRSIEKAVSKDVNKKEMLQIEVQVAKKLRAHIKY